MANPIIFWTQPLDSPATVDEPHILRNDLVTISRKAPSSPAIPGVTAGAYYAQFNDVARTINPARDAVSESGTFGQPGYVPASPAVPANTQYTYTDEGKIGLDGGVFELLPFSSGVSPATTVTFTDFAGTGASGYPKTYNSNDGSPQQTGIPLCGGTANIEVQTSYSLSPMSVAPVSNGTFGTAAVGASVTPGTGTDSPSVTPARITENGWTAYFGDTTGPTVTRFSVDTSVTSEGGGVTNHGPENRISELYTIGGTYHNGTQVYDVHRGSILFEVRPDTEVIISGGNVTQSKTGTASWAAGQSRTLTVTTSGAHGLTDQYNRVYITGASNNAMNGLWNVATVTSDTQFTVKLFAAQCGPAAVTSSVNVVTYDGIDKKGGKLRSRTGSINTIQKVITNNPGSGTEGTPGYVAPSYSIVYKYIGSHGLGSSGSVTASVSGSGYSGGTSGSIQLPDGDFTGSVAIDSSSQFTRTVLSGAAGADGGTSPSNVATGLDASTFNAGNDFEVVAGGMAGNNQVILKGSVSPTSGVPYSFHGNTTSSQVSTIYFTGSKTERSLFQDAGFRLNSTTGRVFTEGAPDTQPSGTDGMPGGFDPNNNPNGGVKEIDTWLPRSMHAKAKALERNDLTELLKANTSGQHQLDQMLNSPMVDASENLTTLMTPREQKEETCWFTLRASKNPSHRRTNTFVENEDYIDRQFGIKVYTNMMSDRNEIILDYVDQSNKDEVANTDTAFVADGVSITNQQHLDNGYANGSFKNQ
jgi:hypothetical protein